MEIKNNKKILITGRTVCMTAGIIAAICGFYWLIRALVYDDTNLPAILSCITCALFLTIYANKRR